MFFLNQTMMQENKSNRLSNQKNRAEMISKLNKTTSYDKQNAENLPKKVYNDLICCVCFSVFVEPVLLPCNHGFCRDCFNKVCEYNTLTCPICRKRFANWLRLATKNNTLVDSGLWNFIKNNHSKSSEEDDKRRKEDSQNTLENFNDVQAVTVTDPKPQVSQPGEFRKEYESQLAAHRKELEIEKQNELKASNILIKKIFQEESQSLNKISSTSQSKNNKTMLVANPGRTPYALNTNKTNCSSKSSLNVVSSSSSSSGGAAAASSGIASSSVATSSSTNYTPSKSSLFKSLTVRLNRGSDLIKQTVQRALLSKIPQPCSSKNVLTVPPTNTHRAPSRNTNSADSLNSELCHFKPIRSVPITPIRGIGGAVIKTPKVKRIIKYGRYILQCPKKSSIPNNFKSPSKYSVFCQVALSKRIPQQTSLHPLQNSPEASTSATKSKRGSNSKDQIPTSSNYQLFKSKPVVKLLRCQTISQQQTDRSKILSCQESTKSRKVKRIQSIPVRGKRKLNGLIIENGKTKRRSNRHGQPLLSAEQQDNEDDANSDLDDDDDDDADSVIFEKIAIEQKRCEDLIKQELLDYEYAKKLQSELDTEKRTNSRKTRHKIPPTSTVAKKIDKTKELETATKSLSKNFRTGRKRKLDDMINDEDQPQLQQKEQHNISTFPSNNNLRRSTRNATVDVAVKKTKLTKDEPVNLRRSTRRAK